MFTNAFDHRTFTDWNFSWHKLARNIKTLVHPIYFDCTPIFQSKNSFQEEKLCRLEGSEDSLSIRRVCPVRFHRPSPHVTFTDLSSVYPLFAAVIRLVAVETDAIVSGISMSHSVRVPRRGRRKKILSFHPPVDSRRLLATSAAPRSEGRAQIGLSSGEVASGKSQEWRVASDMLPRGGGGLGEATRLLLTVPSLAVETSDAVLSRFVAGKRRLIDWYF